LVLGSGWVSDSDLETGQPVSFYGANDRAVSDLTVSRDDRYLLSMGEAPLVWELDEDFASSRTVAGAPITDSQWNGAISPAGDSFVLSGSEVLLWDRNTLRKRLADLQTSYAGRWRFSPDGGVLAGVADAEHVTVLDAATLAPVASFTSAVTGGEVAFSADGSLLATSRLDVFDRQSGALRWSKLREHGQLDGGFVEFSPDGKEVLAADNCECAPTRYDALTGNELEPVPEISGRPSYSPDGTWIVAQGRLVHLATRNVIDYAPDATAAVFTAQGRIVAAEADGSLVLYCRSDE
jgi:WD40 repeat protein